MIQLDGYTVDYVEAPSGKKSLCSSEDLSMGVRDVDRSIWLSESHATPRKVYLVVTTEMRSEKSWQLVENRMSSFEGTICERRRPEEFYTNCNKMWKLEIFSIWKKSSDINVFPTPGSLV